MADLLNEMRRRRLLSGSQEPIVPGQMNPLQMNPGTPPIMETPPTTPTDDYRSYLESAPRREDYSPGLLRKILGGVSGFSTGYFQGPAAGIQAAQQITNQPYNTAYGDWAARGQEVDKLRELYEAKEARGARDRGLDIRQSSVDLGRTRADETARSNQAAEQLGQDKLGLAPTPEERERLLRLRIAGQRQPEPEPTNAENAAKVGMAEAARQDARGEARLKFPTQRQTSPTELIKVEETVDRKLANNPKYEQFIELNEFGETVITPPTTERNWRRDYDPNSSEYQEILRLWQEFNTEREREISRFTGSRGASQQPKQLKDLDEFEVIPSNQGSY